MNCTEQVFKKFDRVITPDGDGTITAIHEGEPARYSVHLGKGFGDVYVAGQLGVRCPYCGAHDETWSLDDLQRGRRERGGGVEYHCYGRYSMD
jgi:hypothetical protein